MKKILISIALIISIASCDRAESKQTFTDKNLKIELLTKFDSTYKSGLYRFNDGDDMTRYFVINSNNSSVLDIQAHTVSTGKATTTTYTDESITTLNK